MSRVHLGIVPDVLEVLARHARASYPLEACGALLGTPRDPVCVVEAAAVRNVHLRPEASFELDAGELLGCLRTAEARGLALLGFFHSHPDGTPQPSSEDRAAGWEGHFCLITSVAADGRVATAAYLAGAEALVEARLVAQV